MNYKTIVIDPPWPITMAGKTRLRPNRAKELPYKTMTLSQIKELTFIEDMAEVGAHVYLWTVNKFLRESFDVFEAWGVKYHLTMVWTKPTGLAPVPTGYKFNTEFCLLGFYGKPMIPFIPNGAPPNYLMAMSKRDNHSSKPSEFYELIRRKSPEPRIDIFARKRHIGFDAYGDQVESGIQEALV